jgi:hypothetical protein
MADWTRDKATTHCLAAISDYCHAKGIGNFPTICDDIGEIILRYFETDRSQQKKAHRDLLDITLQLRKENIELKKENTHLKTKCADMERLEITLQTCTVCSGDCAGANPPVYNCPNLE